MSLAAKQSVDLQNWLDAGFVEKEQRGSHIIYRVIDREAMRDIFYQKFPNEAEGDGTAMDNMRAFADSKARARISQGVCLLRGWHLVQINGDKVDLDKMTRRFGLFATVLQSLEFKRVCIVENLDCFRQAEGVVGTDWLLLHSYGRVGREWLQKVACHEMLVFSDYDFVGLDEFLRVCEVFPEAQFFLPENYEELWRKYAKPLKKRNDGEQIASRRVMGSQHPAVISIREQLLRTGKFLEQQALFV